MPEPLREAVAPQSHQDLVVGCLLLLLAEQRGHGYELHERIGQMMPLWEVGAGNLYRELRRMDADGVVASVWEASQTRGPARRVYEITAAGRRALDEWIMGVGGARRDARGVHRHVREASNAEADAAAQAQSVTGPGASERTPRRSEQPRGSRRDTHPVPLASGRGKQDTLVEMLALLSDAIDNPVQLSATNGAAQSPVSFSPAVTPSRGIRPSAAR